MEYLFYQAESIISTASPEYSESPKNKPTHQEPCGHRPHARGSAPALAVPCTSGAGVTPQHGSEAVPALPRVWIIPANPPSASEGSVLQSSRLAAAWQRSLCPVCLRSPFGEGRSRLSFLICSRLLSALALMVAADAGSATPLTLPSCHSAPCKEAAIPHGHFGR